MVKLLQRFYLPTGGAVRLDGRDLGLYSPKWLKRHIGLVAQEPTLYSRSIYRSAASQLHPRSSFRERGSVQQGLQDRWLVVA